MKKLKTYLILVSVISNILTNGPNSSQPNFGIYDNFSCANERRPILESSCIGPALSG